MSEHTSGPWDYWPQVAYPQGVVTDGWGRHVAVPTLITLETAAANGRVMAAAPDLLSVLDLLATARQQAVDAEALAAERTRLDEERRRLEAEQAAAEAARLAAQRAQEDADRRAAEAAAAAERAALQAAVAQAQQEVARLTVAAAPEPVPTAAPARVEPTVPTWRVTDEQLQQARAWALALHGRSPTHAALVFALLDEIDGWRAGV